LQIEHFVKIIYLYILNLFIFKLAYIHNTKFIMIIPDMYTVYFEQIHSFYCISCPLVCPFYKVFGGIHCAFFISIHEVYFDLLLLSISFPFIIYWKSSTNHKYFSWLTLIMWVAHQSSWSSWPRTTGEASCH
jgi:hypothetical protein